MKHPVILLTLVCLAMPVAKQSRADAATPPLTFVDGTTNRLIAIIDSDDSAAGKARRLQAVVDAAVDVDAIGRFCLGRYWRVASAVQQQEFLGLFHRVLLDGVTGQMSGYRGVTITMGRAMSREEGVVVSSLVARPGQKVAKVDWLVAPSQQGGLLIEDIVAEGTSLRLTRRNDYAAYLASHGNDVSLLLAAMRQRLDQR